MTGQRTNATRVRTHSTWSRVYRLAAIGGACVVGVAGLAACGSGSSDDGGSSGGGKASDPILIGAPQPLTGGGAAFGVPQLHAAQLVVDDINAHGGIKELGGAKLKLIVADSQSDPAIGGQLVRKMAGQKVSAFIGPILSASVVANLPTIQRAKIPLFTPSLDDRVTNNNAGYVFRTVNRASAWAVEGAQYLHELEQTKGTPIKRIGVVGINVPPGTSSNEAMEAEAKKNGWAVTYVDYDQESTKDFAPIVAKLKAANVQVVTGYQNPNDAVAFAKAVTAQSWRPEYGFMWISGGQYLNSFKKALGTKVNGWMDVSYTGGLTTDKYSQNVQDVAQRYEEKYHEPLDGVAASEGATMSVVADAIAKAKSRDPQKIAEAARQLTLKSGEDSEYQYFTQAGGIAFNDKQDNTAWVGPIIQLAGTADQNVVYPESVASSPVQWPQKASK